ncbi:MAG: bifunctional glutamate N-acetyltransferase/amino-acid acetyltransferase ArgJ [Pseudomonadota bacterium]
MVEISHVSPLAPASGFPALAEISGLQFAALAAGIKYKGRDDVMLAVAGDQSVVAGTFTKSATRSAPVLDCEIKLELAKTAGPVAIFVNSGNANAFTGGNGLRSVERITAEVARVTHVPQSRVFTASTGVIGEVLPDDRITERISDLAGMLAPDQAERAARATMTTDTYPKGAQATVDLSEGPAKIIGFAKGSGMIAPDMATMLVHLFSDVKIAQPRLQEMVGRLTDQTFNCITVDSDTSTSDTILVVATGEGPKVSNSDEAAFETALHQVMLDLAHQVVKDGEGATKFVEIRVEGAVDNASAKTVGLSIANSPLVKTAIAGEDPNWGRIVMAVGKAGEPADRDKLSIRFGEIEVAREGWVANDYREEDGAAYMKNADLLITVALGMGAGAASVWTCDLSHQYITINADYRS